ncbi:MAG: DUF6054 family protein [Acutalibacteraceae bacterium]
MAKYESYLRGDFNEILRTVNNAVMGGSASATLEDSSDFNNGSARCAVRVYERYSWSGGNRVSLNVTLFSSSDDVFISAIASGGSQAVLFKVNTLGEEAFLETLSSALSKYEA